MKRSRIEILSKPSKNQTLWVTIGYYTAFLGGIAGIIIGLHLSTHKRTLPNGDRVYDYSESDRKHGTRIFYIGLICLPVLFLLRILYNIDKVQGF